MAVLPLAPTPNPNYLLPCGPSKSNISNLFPDALITLGNEGVNLSA
jgi:hypothetical protein